MLVKEAEMIYYYLRTERKYDSYMKARAAQSRSKENLVVGYFKPAIMFKSWVPGWLIRLIKQKEE